MLFDASVLDWAWDVVSWIGEASNDASYFVLALLPLTAVLFAAMAAVDWVRRKK